MLNNIKLDGKKFYATIQYDIALIGFAEEIAKERSWGF
jgi:hypothetical protein